MKKYLLTLALFLFVFGFSQNNGYYPDYDDYYYGDIYDYPDDYYSEYPDDYYPDDYYTNSYNDYRKTIVGINWNQLFVELNLNSVQINAIMVLNNRFPSFTVWNQFYRVNPTRWYYDRFYALRRVLSPQQYIIFQNRYYGGTQPIVYFVNHYHNYYLPRYRVRPRYRSININIYRRSPWQVRTVNGKRRVIVSNRNIVPNNRNTTRNRNVITGRRDQNHYNRSQNNRSSRSNVGIRNNRIPNNGRNETTRTRSTQRRATPQSVIPRTKTVQRNAPATRVRTVQKTTKSSPSRSVNARSSAAPTQRAMASGRR